VEQVNIDAPDLAAPVREEPVRFWTEDVMRALLAFVFALFFLIVIVGGFWNVSASAGVWGQTKELLDTLVPAIVALFGSAVGFYFGTQKAP
jgi:hypothetical protein